ncbi:MAG: hypothetical protein LBF17_06640, partial [Mediterranea sp.]|nr:hypothetical protein [Mediterranea sp.]
ENERLAKVEEAYAFVTSKEQTDAVTAKVKEYNDLSEKTCELYIQYRKENYAANLKSAEVNALWNIYNNADQIASNIASCDTSITYYERQIADVSSIETKEEAIEKKKVDIANKEAEIALKEKDVANAKAAFEAAAGEEAEADAGNE